MTAVFPTRADTHSASRDVAHSARSTLASNLLRDLVRGSLIAGLMVLTAQLVSGTAMVSAAGFGLTLLWPPIGIGLGALLRFGLRPWPFVLLGNLVAYSFISMPVGERLLAALLETAFPVVTIAVLRRGFSFDRRLTRERDVLALSLVGGAVLTAPITFIEAGALALRTDAGWVRFLTLGIEYWLESAMAVLVIAPLFLVVRPAELMRLPRARKLEGLALASATFAVTFFAHSRLDGVSHHGYLVAMLVFPLVVVAAMRFGKAGSALLAATCAMAATIGFARQSAPPTDQALTVALIDQFAFLITVAMAGMLIAVMLLRRIGTELLLASTEASFRSLFEHSPIGIAIEREGVVRFVNRALLSMLGGEAPKDLVGKHSAAWLAADATARHGTTRESTCLRLDGSAMPVFVTEAAIPQVDGVEIVRFVTDLTAKRRLEDELHQARRMETVGLLASGVAHDFNNLLTVISGYVELMREPASRDVELLQPLDNVATAAEKAAALTRQLLAIGTGKPSRKERIDLSRRVRDFAHFVRRVVGRHIDLRLDLASEGPQVEVEPTRLDQVLLNLVVNARDALCDGGTLTLRVREAEVDESTAQRSSAAAGRFAMLEVADDGIGMDAPTLARVFEPFFTTKSSGGTGLGLATVKGIVDAERGCIAVRSAPGKGTTITVALPLATASVASSPRVAPPSHGVLVVQDDPTLRNLMVQVLARDGLRVRAAATAPEALELVRRDGGRCDLLLADVVMPHTGGADLERALKREWPELRSLFLSGYSEPELLTIRRENLEHRLLPKPFTTAQLLERVRSVLSPT